MLNRISTYHFDYFHGYRDSFGIGNSSVCEVINNKGNS